MDALAEAVPAENPQTEERRFDEERDDRLHRQGSAENVPGVVPETAPRHAELELHHDARDDADRVVDDVQLAPEAHHTVVHGIVREDGARLDDGDDGRETQGQGDEEEVSAGGEGELQPCEIERFWFHACDCAGTVTSGASAWGGQWAYPRSCGSGRRRTAQVASQDASGRVRTRWSA